MDRARWRFVNKGKTPRGGGLPMKQIAARFPLSDWKLIEKAAAEAGKPMGVWLVEVAEPSIAALRQDAAQA